MNIYKYAASPRDGLTLLVTSPGANSENKITQTFKNEVVLVIYINIFFLFIYIFSHSGMSTLAVLEFKRTKKLPLISHIVNCIFEVRIATCKKKQKLVSLQFFFVNIIPCT